MARGSGFGALGKNFIIVGNAQHRIFGLTQADVASRSPSWRLPTYRRTFWSDRDFERHAAAG